MTQPDGSAEPAGYCTTCGSAFSSGQLFCGQCGQQLAGYRDPFANEADAPVSETAAHRESSQQPLATPDDDVPYGAGATLGAILVSVFMPVIASSSRSCCARRNVEPGEGSS